MGAGAERARFATTRWSLVLATRAQGSADAAAALAALCQAYWFPGYAFIRRSGRTEDAARDLTQGFFARMLEKNYLQDADRARGRFRTFLLASVTHFLAKELKADHALKRGGGAIHLSLETDDEERRFCYEPPDVDSPDRVDERRWAHAVLDQAMARLAAHYAESGRLKWFLDPAVRCVVSVAASRHAAAIQQRFDPAFNRHQQRWDIVVPSVMCAERHAVRERALC